MLQEIFQIDVAVRVVQKTTLENDNSKTLMCSFQNCVYIPLSARDMKYAFFIKYVQEA